MLRRCSALVVGVLACTPAPPIPDAGVTVDAGVDAGAEGDAGFDAGVTDAGPPVVVAASTCSLDFRQPGDTLAFSDLDGGWVQATVSRGATVIGWGRARKGSATVRVREAGRFTPVCGPMIFARAGHAAVKLADGAVQLSGGYRDVSGAPTALFTTELFDATAESFAPGVDLAVAGGTQLPRAFHSGTLLPNGQVLLYGGERYASAPPFMASPLTSALVYDHEATAVGVLGPRGAPPNIARSRHAALTTPAGVLLIGGVKGSAPTPVLEVELFDPSVNQVKVGGTLQAAVVAGAWVATRQRAALISGTAIDLVEPTQLGITREAAALTAARAAPWAFASGDEVLVVGEGSSEIVNLATHAVTPGPAVPSAPGGCAVALGGERWLFVSGTSATLVSRSGWSATALPALPTARAEASCTLLDDGTVLVAGGENLGVALGVATIFTPPLP